MMNHAIIRILLKSDYLSLRMIIMKVAGCGLIVITELCIERAVKCYMQCTVWMLISHHVHGDACSAVKKECY